LLAENRTLKRTVPVLLTEIEVLLRQAAYGRLRAVANDRFVELHLAEAGFRRTAASEKTN